VIEVRDLSKRYGDKPAVDHLSFAVEPGKVTGFLGPNGAGKSTTMRLILGLDRADSGTATIGGRRYAELSQPLLMVGALLEARAVHSGRSAYNHLLVLAQTQNLPRRRVEDVIDLVGLREAAGHRAASFSLGMSQRLGIRNLMKRLASEGRTVFVSSHLMNEMAVTADHLVVIGRGQLIADCATQEFITRSSERSVRVVGQDPVRLQQVISGDGGRVLAGADGALTVSDVPAPRIGELAAQNNLVLHELTPQLASLEEAFMELTRDSVEYGGQAQHVTTPATDPASATLEAEPR